MFLNQERIFFYGKLTIGFELLTVFNSEKSETIQYIEEQARPKMCPSLHFPNCKDKL